MENITNPASSLFSQCCNIGRLGEPEKVRADSGQAIIEMMILLPIFLVLMIGTVEFDVWPMHISKLPTPLAPGSSMARRTEQPLQTPPECSRPHSTTRRTSTEYPSLPRRHIFVHAPTRNLLLSAARLSLLVAETIG